MDPSMVRLQEVAGTNKKSKIALDLNVGASTVTNWANRGVSKEGALAAAEKYNADANYILNGSLPHSTVSELKDKIKTKQSASDLAQEMKDVESIKNSKTVQVSDDASGMIEIPLYGVYFCCGDGDTNCEFQEIKGTRKFSPSFFRERNIQPENFKLVCASNGSMAPYINDKDEVGLNLGSTEVHDGKVYAILLDGDRMFKQIFREAGSALRLHSFNSDYPDRLVTAENHQSLIIVGEQVYRAG